MPDKVRSVDDMVADMEKAVEEPEGNTSSGKHRQHVAQAIEKLISSQIIDGKLRYIEDGTGSKAATKTAPALLNVAAAVQEMVSEMSGRKMSYTITIKGKDAAAAVPCSFTSKMASCHLYLAVISAEQVTSSFASLLFHALLMQIQ